MQTVLATVEGGGGPGSTFVGEGWPKRNHAAHADLQLLVTRSRRSTIIRVVFGSRHDPNAYVESRMHGLQMKSICKFFLKMDVIFRDESSNDNKLMIGYNNTIVTIF